MSKITQEYLKSILDYNPQTGNFIWKERKNVCHSFNKMFAGKIAGNRKGGKYGNYWAICIDGKKQAAQRLAWLYTFNEWPDIDIDHIDGNGLNNSIKNLRLATRSQNLMNAAMRSNNKSGYRGVSKQGNKWMANIRIDKKRIYLGSYECPTAARLAYLKKAKELFGEFTRFA